MSPEIPENQTDEKGRKYIVVKEKMTVKELMDLLHIREGDGYKTMLFSNGLFRGQAFPSMNLAPSDKLYRSLDHPGG